MKFLSLKFKNIILLSLLLIGFFYVAVSQTSAWGHAVMLNYICGGGPCPVATTVFFNFNGPESVNPGGQININFQISSDDNPQGGCPVARYRVTDADPYSADMEPGCYTPQEFRNDVFSLHTLTAPMTPGSHNLCVSTGLNGYAVPPVQCFVYTVTAPPSGNINVSSNIPGASWTITGPSTNSGSGYSGTYNSQPTGSYTIVWGNVAGYTTPPSTSQNLSSGDNITFSGNYTSAPAVQLNFTESGQPQGQTTGGAGGTN